MKFVFFGLVLAAAAYFLVHTPAGQATLLHAQAAGNKLSSNIVGDFTH